MRLCVSVGYHRTTHAEIARAVSMTRGTLLYHFPTQADLLTALVDHIEVRRAALLEGAAASPVPAGADAAEHAVDVYWALLAEAPFVAFAELEAAARTDALVAERLAPARATFDHAELGGVRVGALVQAGADPRFLAARDLGRFLLEGLAKGSMTYDEPARKARLIAIVKRAVRMLNRRGERVDLWES